MKLTYITLTLLILSFTLVNAQSVDIPVPINYSNIVINETSNLSLDSLKLGGQVPSYFYSPSNPPPASTPNLSNYSLLNQSNDFNGTIRTVGYQDPTSGKGVEFMFFDDAGNFFPFDRDNSKWLDFSIYGHDIFIAPQEGVTYTGDPDTNGSLVIGRTRADDIDTDDIFQVYGDSYITGNVSISGSMDSAIAINTTKDGMSNLRIKSNNNQNPPLRIDPITGKSWGSILTPLLSTQGVLFTYQYASGDDLMLVYWDKNVLYNLGVIGSAPWGTDGNGYSGNYYNNLNPFGFGYQVRGTNLETIPSYVSIKQLANLGYGIFNPGTITCSGTSCTGTGTDFTRDFKVGESIRTTSPSNTKTIATITDATHLTTTTSWTAVTDHTYFGSKVINFPSCGLTGRVNDGNLIRLPNVWGEKTVSKVIDDCTLNTTTATTTVIYANLATYVGAINASTPDLVEFVPDAVNGGYVKINGQQGITGSYIDGTNTQIDVNGGIVIGISTAYDQRLMQNITYLSNGSGLNPVTFYWNEQGLKQFRDRNQWKGVLKQGYVAQDVQRFYPECVVNEEEYYYEKENKTKAVQMQFRDYEQEDGSIITVQENWTKIVTQSVEVKKKLGDFITYNRDCINVKQSVEKEELKEEIKLLKDELKKLKTDTCKEHNNKYDVCSEVW